MVIIWMIRCIFSYICSLLRSFLHTGTREAVVSTPSTYEEHIKSSECEGASDHHEWSLKAAISQPAGQQKSQMAGSQSHDREYGTSKSVWTALAFARLSARSGSDT
jgi:hypothetical protein